MPARSVSGHPRPPQLSTKPSGERGRAWGRSGIPITVRPVTAPGELDMYVKAFARLTELAVYGADARALIVKAIDALS